MVERLTLLLNASRKNKALSEKDEEIKKLQAEIQELQKQHDRVKAECDKKGRSIADMQMQIKKLQDDVGLKDSQIKDFIRRINELRDSIAEKSDQAADLLELAARYDASIVKESSDSVEARRFELEAAMWKRKVADSEAELLQARTELQQVENDAFQLQSEIINVTHKLNESERLLQGALHERNELTKEVASLSAQLNAKTDEIDALTRSLAETEKSAKDVREALTAEVAEKHDQLLALRRDVIQLEEQCRQADMQTHFKDDIIKEMRKDVKLARSKLAILEEVVKDRGYSGDIGQRLLALNELACSLPTKSVSYEYQNQFPSASFAYEPNVNSERIAQVLPYHRVSDSTKFSLSHQFCTEKTHNAVDLHSAVEKTYRHSNSLRHNSSYDKLPRTRTKSTRTQNHLSRVEEALKQELSKLNDQASCKLHQQREALKQELSKLNDQTSCKPHQQHTPCRDVEVVKSTTSTRTIGVQYSQQKQAQIMVDAKNLEAKERRILELERTLKDVQKDMRKQFDEQKSMNAQKQSMSPDQFSALKEHLEVMMNNLKDRDDKIIRQNVMIEELESRLEDVRKDLLQLHDRAEGYLKQMNATQKNHDESQRRISELQETLDSARQSMNGSLNKLQASVDKKDVTKSMDNVLDYQHKAEECQAALNAMKGEMELLLLNQASRQKQIQNLEETVSTLKGSLGTAKGEMEKAHHMAMTYLKEKEIVEAMQKSYEDNIEKLKRALLACQEEKILHHSEEKEMASILPDNMERIDELLKQDESTTKLLEEAIKELFDSLRHAAKADENALEPQKKSAVKFSEKSPEDYELQIKELQRQLKETQAIKSPEGGSKPTPPAAIVLAREVEEYRVKTVEAQAALEELKDVIDSLHQNVQSRENQISALEKMITSLVDTLLCAQKDMSVLREKIEHYEKMKKVNDFFSNPDGDVSQRKMQPSLDASCGETYDPYSALTTSDNLVPDMEERWICMQKSLNKAFIEIRNIWDKAVDYTKLREECEVNRSYNEQKLEKLYLELESTQEDLKNTVIELHDSLPAVASRVSIAKALVNYKGKDEEASVAIAKMTEEIDVLLKELELRDQQIAKQEAQLIALREALNSSQNELSEVKMTAKLEKDQFEIERTECERKLKDLQQDLKAAEYQIKMYKDKYLQEPKEPLPREIPSDPAKDDRIKELEEMLKRYEQELEEFKEKTVEETEVPMAEVKSVADDAADYDGSDEDANRNIKELKEEIARLAAKLDSSSVEAMEHVEANKVLKEKLLEAVDEMQNLRKNRTKQNGGEQSNEQKVIYLEEELKAAQEEMRLFRDRLLQQSQVPPPQTDLAKLRSAVSEIVDYRGKDPEANRIITCLEEEMDTLLDALQERDNKVAALYDQLSRLRQEQFEAQNELQTMKRQAKLEQIEKHLQSDYDKELKIQELEDDLEYTVQELNLYKGRVEDAEKISDEKPVVEPVRSYVAEAVDYRGRDQESNKTINNLKAEIARLLDEVNLKNEQIAKEKEMNTTLQERLNQTKDVKQQLEDKFKLKQTEEQSKNQLLEEKIKLLKQELKTAEDELNMYREELTIKPEVIGKKPALPEVKSFIAGIIDYHGKDEEANRNIADLKAEIARLLSELNSSNIEVSEQEEINKTLMEELNHLRSDYQRLKKDMLTKQTQTKLELQNYEEKVADLECDLKAALEQVKTYRLKEIERFETPMKSEKSFVAESVNYQGKDGEASQKIASLKAEIDKLVNELNARNNEVATKEAMNKSLQSELNQALDNLTELKQQVREKRIKEESGFSYEQRIAELQKDLQDAKEEILNYIEKIEKAQTVKSPAVEPMKSFLADSIDYHGKDIEARHHIASLKNEISNLLDELNTRNAQFATKEDVNKSLRDHRNLIREESKALEREARVQRDQLQLGIKSNEQQIKNLEEDLKFAQEQIKMFKDNLLSETPEAAQEQPSVEPVKSVVAETIVYSGSDEEANRNILDLKTEIDRLLGHLNSSNVKVAAQEEVNKILQTELGSIQNELQKLKEELGKDSGQQSNETQEQEYKMLLQELAATEEELSKYREQHKQQSEVPAQKPIVAVKKSACLQTSSQNWKDEEASKRVSALQKEMKSLLSEIYSRDAQIAALICQIDVLQGQTPHQRFEFFNEMQEAGFENVTGVTETMESLEKDKQIQNLQEELDAAQKQINELLAQKHVSQRSSVLLARSPSIRREVYTGTDERAKVLIKRLQAEIDNLTKELESRDGQNESQERTIDSLRSSLLVAEHAIKDLKNQKEKAEAEVVMLQTKLESKSGSDRSNVLQMKVDDLEAQLAACNDVKRALQVRIDNLQKSIEDNEMEIQALRKSRPPSEDAVKVFNQTVEELQTRLAKQSETIKYHLQTIDSLRKALRDAQANQSQRDSKYTRSDLASEEEALKNEIAKCYETIGDLEEKNRSLQKKLDELEKVIESQKDAIQTRKNEIETLREKEIGSIIPNEEEVLKKRLSHRKSVVIDDPKTNTIHELEDRVKWLEKELAIRDSMLKRQASDPSKEILKDRINYLEKQLQRKSVSSLPSDNEVLKEQRETIKKLEDTVSTRDAMIEKLNTENIQLSQQQVQPTSIRSIIKPTRAKSLTLSFEDQNIEELKKRVKSLEADLAECEAKIHKHIDDHNGENLKKEIEELEKKLVERDTVIKRYKEDKDRLDKKLLDLEEKLSAINKYKDDQKTQNERLLELEKELAVREALIKEHKEDKEKLNAELKVLENQLAICRASTDQQKREKEQINEELTRLQKEHNACEALIKQHKENIESLTEKQKQLENELAESKALVKTSIRTPSCEKMMKELEGLRKELASHAQMNASQEKIIENLQQSHSDTQAELKELQAKSNELEESRRSSTNQMMERYKEQLQLTQAQLEQQAKENKQQAETIAHLQSSLETAKSNLAATEEKAREADRKLRRAEEEQVSTNERNKEKIEELQAEVTAREAEVQNLVNQVDLLKNSLDQEQQRVMNRIEEADKKIATDRAAALEICNEKLAGMEESKYLQTRENLLQAQMIELLERGKKEAIEAREKAEERARAVEHNCHKKLQDCEVTVRELKDENEILQQKVKELQEALAESKRKAEEYAKQFKDLAYCKAKLEELERLADSQEKEIRQQAEKTKNLNDDSKVAKRAKEKAEERAYQLAKQFEDYKAENEAKLKNLKAKEMQLGELSRKCEEQQDELEKLKHEVKTLQSALQAKEKVAEDQKEELEIQQESLEMAQNELKELQDKLKELMEYQQSTISHLQHALLSTRHQLEELQGKGSFELKIKDCIIKVLHLDLTEIETQYRDCYGEVVKREKSLETLRDANVDLSVQAFYLQQDVGILQLRLADYLHSLRITKGQLEGAQNENERLKKQIEDLEAEISQLREQLSKEENEENKEDEKEDEKQDAETPEGYEELKKENDTLKEEIERLKQELQEEAEQNKTNSDRLQKLENMFKVQAIEMQRNEELNRLLRLKYEDVLKKNKEMENELTSLNSQVMDFQHQLDLSEERSDMVQRELDACKETLGHMKEKTESLKELLKEKSNQVTDLAKDCAATRDNMQSLNNEAMMLASDARYEVDTLKQKVQNLQRSLEAANANYQRVGEDARRHQAQLLDSANREIKLQMEFTTKENFLLDKLHKTQTENAKMSDVVDLLNRDNQELRTELAEREGQLQATANKLQNLVQDTAKLQKEMESKDNAMKRLEGGLSRSNLKLMQALNHIENKDKMIEDLKKELRAAQTEHFHRTVSPEHRSALMEEASNLRSEIRRLLVMQEKINLEHSKLQEQLQEGKLQGQAQNEELQQQVHMLQLAVMDAKDQCKEAQLQLKEYAAANNQLKATCKNLETENARLQEQLQGDKVRDNKLQEQVKMVQLAAMSAKDKSYEAQQQLREYAAQNSQLAAKCKNLENENARLEEQLQGDKIRDNKLQEQVKMLQLAVMSAKDKSCEAQQQLREYAAQNNQLAAKCKDLENENARLEEQLQGDKIRDNKLQEQVKMLQLAVMSAKDKSCEAQQQLRQYAAQNNQLAAKCKDLENELDNLQAAFQQKEALANQLMNERQNMVKNSSELRYINVALRQALRSSRRRETKLLDWPPPGTSQSYYLEDASPRPALSQAADSTYWVMSKSSTSLWPNEDENVKKNNLYWKRKLQNTDYYDDPKETAYHSSSSK